MKVITSESNVRRAVRKILLEIRTKDNFMSNLTATSIAGEADDIETFLKMVFFDDPNSEPDAAKATIASIGDNFYNNFVADLDTGTLTGAALSDLYVEYLTLKFGPAIRFKKSEMGPPPAPIPVSDFVGDIDEILLRFGWSLTFEGLNNFTIRLLNRQPLRNPDAPTPDAEPAPSPEQFAYFTPEQMSQAEFDPGVTAPTAIAFDSLEALLDIAEISVEWHTAALDKYQKDVLDGAISDVETIVDSMRYTFGIPIDPMFTGDDLTSFELLEIGEILRKTYESPPAAPFSGGSDALVASRAIVNSANSIYKNQSPGGGSLAVEIIISLVLGAGLGIAFQSNKWANAGGRLKTRLETDADLIDSKIIELESQLKPHLDTKIGQRFIELKKEVEELEASTKNLTTASEASADVIQQQTRAPTRPDFGTASEKLAASARAEVEYAQEMKDYTDAMAAYEAAVKERRKNNLGTKPKDVFDDLSVKSKNALQKATGGDLSKLETGAGITPPTKPGEILDPDLKRSYEDFTTKEKARISSTGPRTQAEKEAQIAGLKFPDGTSVKSKIEDLETAIENKKLEVAKLKEEIPNQWNQIGKTYEQLIDQFKLRYQIKNYAGQFAAYYIAVATLAGATYAMNQFFQKQGKNGLIVAKSLTDHYNAKMQRQTLLSVAAAENSLAFQAGAFAEDPIELSRTFTTGDSSEEVELARQIKIFAEKAIDTTLTKTDVANLKAALAEARK